uniref:Cytochrome c oxidase subunit 3 n=1 Tax=Sphyranura euryceae TaxID=2996394 RepID=A0AA51YE05_9PLAT|nr:cytochrome c oxidase subunit III [Sphyranura euryceae]WMV02079.1 cytochrome c oxidase subunit 3 [Sphyranura euryceae]
MISVFPIVCSGFISILFFFSSIFINIGSWSYILVFLLMCLSFLLVIYIESPIWCCFDETSTASWYKFFVSGELILFMSLMLPIFWVVDEAGQDCLSDPFGVPLLGLFVLLLSSFCVVQFEHIIEGYENSGFVNFNLDYTSSLGCGSVWLLLTIFNGIGFIILQLIEFGSCPMNILNSSWYSCCLVLVSFHGFHVFVGICFLIMSYKWIYTINNNNFNLENYIYQFRFIYFVCFYWHFVDFIWFIVYFLVYFNP